MQLECPVGELYDNPSRAGLNVTNCDAQMVCNVAEHFARLNRSPLRQASWRQLVEPRMDLGTGGGVEQGSPHGLNDPLPE